MFNDFFNNKFPIISIYFVLLTSNITGIYNNFFIHSSNINTINSFCRNLKCLSVLKKPIHRNGLKFNIG